MTTASVTKHYTAQHRLEMVERLAAKWRRHQAEEYSDYLAGMTRAYAECIRLELGEGMTLDQVESALASGQI